MSRRPDNPAGAYIANPKPTLAERNEMIAMLGNFPPKLRQTLAGLKEEQLATKYRNWTIRQIVNHLADSHMNGYIRFRLALTEPQPTIKPYDETAWSNLRESRTTDVQVSLQLLDALHARWVRLLESMNDGDFTKTYFHPEHQTVVSLGEALGVYFWHGKHHMAQIEMVAKELK